MTSTLESVDFEIHKQDFQRTRFVEGEVADPQPGEAVLAVDRFSYTANNLTYVVAGEMLNYWSFFPAAEGWGRPPVWGFGDVVRSRHPELAERARLRLWRSSCSGVWSGSPAQRK